MQKDLDDLPIISQFALGKADDSDRTNKKDALTDAKLSSELFELEDENEDANLREYLNKRKREREM